MIMRHEELVKCLNCELPSYRIVIFEHRNDTYFRSKITEQGYALRAKFCIYIYIYSTYVI